MQSKGWHYLCKGDYFNCIECGDSFWRKPNQIKKGQNKFCSKPCYQKWQKGVPKSEEFKEFCKTRTGEKSPTWKGGVTPERIRIRNSKAMREWRKSVFERDSYQCQHCQAKCGNGKNVYLHAHHIKGFAEHPDLRFDVDNGLTLCKACHYKVHSNA